ncbi:MAG: DUF4399 domain-containing protein [Gammaproteobacteria bacterium]|nr:DUF4399 domain-containing protein [Gammaproteobacteria bacterium]
MSFRIHVLFIILLLLAAGMALARTPAPAGASVYIISPADGETVSSPVTVRFGLTGMGVAPAGVEKKNTGHHHLLIDLEGLPDMNKPLTSDAHHRHFGGGQTQVTVELAPGKHTLQLIMGDQVHIPHEPPVISEKISVTVK